MRAADQAGEEYSLNHDQMEALIGGRAIQNHHSVILNNGPADLSY